ncbi:MAG: sulfotransferase domain-containing protein [Anaerolineae bacterium]|nr:sulfotransferase domain-containing protein [Anaerolineae bacterium]
MERIGRGHFVSGHLPFTGERAAILGDLAFATTLILRDPRDIVVSHMYYVTYRAEHHRLHGYFASLPDDSTRLRASILGVDEALVEGDWGLEDLGARLRSYLAWADHGCCIVRFENLVGPQGGGSRELQLGEVSKLAAHVGFDLSKQDLERIAERIFYRRSWTFRRGAIGDWRNHFASQHKAALKEVAGQVLIDLGYEADLDW